MSSSNDNRTNTENGERESNLPQAVRMRLRAVAEREASRLARPDRPNSDFRLAHASKSKSAVSSTPFGYPQQSMLKKEKDSTSEEWCGPFSVARQVCAHQKILFLIGLCTLYFLCTINYVDDCCKRRSTNQT